MCTAPCMDCGDRCMGCHSTCSKYKSYRDEHDRETQAKVVFMRKQHDYYSYMKDKNARLKRYA